MTYALIQWGGSRVGHRPRTKLAYVTPIKDDASLLVDLIDKDGRSIYKRSRYVDPTHVLHTFGRELPSPAAVRHAKLTLEIVTDDD